ncbi:MAG: zinc ABC transporter solute-binding protein [Verrucomicrobia bacterium]|nr:zinc ABC transporter solute-binding protein [Verrucomicrobiota bacterium]MBT7069007.1 zinc ABC transporter solute-binding protein [Verrucomicrobiota bacterium]MBT7700113.1 zinc ABC transporter solute-binding protein [Verrucomicrobiota bacterium]
MRTTATTALRTCVGVAILALGVTAFAESGARPRIVCSTTQTANLALQIVGDDMEVVCILGPGVNPHVYQPVPGDSRLVETAALCLQNGLHLEGKNWMQTLARDNGNKPLVTCTDGVQPLDLEYEGQTVKDPHAWFDPRNAAIYLNNILAAVIKIDPAGAARYRSRTDLYLQQLRALDAWIVKQVSLVPVERRILVTSHDAFNYFAARYGFKVRSPVGWSTGSEIGGGMTPARRRLVVQSVRDFKVPAIFVETSVNPKMIRQIAEEAGVRVGGELYSDAMGEAGSAGETYLGMMRENTLQVVTALAGTR